MVINPKDYAEMIRKANAIQAGAFRVWDSQESRYTRPDEPFALLPSGRLAHWDTAPQMTGTNEAVLMRMTGDRYQIERWTGLYDSKGKAVYEGDLLKSRFGSLWQVSFEAGSFFAEEVDSYSRQAAHYALNSDLQAVVAGTIHDDDPAVLAGRTEGVGDV